MKLCRKKVDVRLAQLQLGINEICDKSGVSRETFKQCRRGVRNAKPKTIGKIAAALGVDVLDILDTGGEAGHAKTN